MLIEHHPLHQSYSAQVLIPKNSPLWSLEYAKDFDVVRLPHIGMDKVIVAEMPSFSSVETAFEWLFTECADQILACTTQRPKKG